MPAKKATPQEIAMWLHQTMNILANELEGEFGYDTLDVQGQLKVLEEVVTNFIPEVLDESDLTL